MPLPRCPNNWGWMRCKSTQNLNKTPFSPWDRCHPSRNSASRCLAHSQLASRSIAHHPAFHRKGVDILKGRSCPAELQTTMGNWKNMAPLKRHARNPGISKAWMKNRRFCFWLTLLINSRMFLFKHRPYMSPCERKRIIIQIRWYTKTRNQF